MAQAMLRSLATPVTKTLFPCISPLMTSLFPPGVPAQPFPAPSASRACVSSERAWSFPAWRATWMPRS